MAGQRGQSGGSAPGNVGVVTDQQSAMAVFSRGGESVALMLGGTTDLKQTFPSSAPGPSRGLWQGVAGTTEGWL